MIIKELLHRESVRRIRKQLFLICLTYANFTTVFTEHFALFDEDEKEVRRQLNLGLKTHISTVILIMLTALFFNPIYKLLLLVVYLFWILKYAIEWYKPISNRIKTLLRQC